MSPTTRTLISPGRHVRGRGATQRLGEYLAPPGSTPLIIADDKGRPS
ncbi:hypothetical protein WIS52_15640 [Pseudonocardia nematodicida]|uniref:Uncharacterized protein n=1 Tax=Pseudonocardia nematodicida TaxID=1206997 RepID=A0ABV1KBP9_9PSEU